MIRSTDAGYNGPVVIAVFLEHVACVSLASKSRVEYVNDAVNTIMSGCNNFIVHLGDLFLKCDSCIHILVATVAHVDLGPSLLDMICIVNMCGSGSDYCLRVTTITMDISQVTIERKLLQSSSSVILSLGPALRYMVCTPPSRLFAAKKAQQWHKH